MFRHVLKKNSHRLFRSPCSGFLRSDLVALRCVTSVPSKAKSTLRGLVPSSRLPMIAIRPNEKINLSQLSSLRAQVMPSRQFWGVTVAFNQVDPERVRLAGPDRAAAEWVLRNGGTIKWKDAPRPLENYNLLPSTDFEKYKLQDIDLTATDVVGLGFQHLENLDHIKSVKLHGCRTIMNDALEHLHFVKDTLEWLQISKCPMINEKGLELLHQLKKLKTLVIYDLIELKNFDDSISRLSRAMPWCEILCDDPSFTKPEEDDTNK